MPNRYLIANWKMNIPPEGIASYLDAVKDADAVIAPPFVYVKDVAARFANAAAQNCADQKSGAFTGEVSADMLRDCGARFVIVGHSERRTVYGEDDALIARKLAMAIDAGLTPVLCIGENEQQRERGHAVNFCSGQLRAAAIPQLASANEIIVAYEPIWAIGTGRNATGAMVAEIVSAIRDALNRFWPSGLATPILYGGSVTPDNVDDLIEHGRIDGFLVGGASLDSKKFLALAEAMKRLPAQP
ncbi:MAG TPA: triose-phosphate isomerase [Thermoanaerobaculia bacterium]|jgi:triosephosphate isomerase|nr:triose-phosphate isomerase [Thermoanaerobaculia bacterium]